MTPSPTLHRRACLALGLGAAAFLSACAATPGAAPDDIVDSATRRPLTRAELLARVRASDYVLLGEQHDNPDHHRLRGELLAGLRTPVTVVAEHLPLGAAPVLTREMSGSMLLPVLEAAGFDAKGWRWPLHEPLFTAIAAGGHALRGGNLPRDQARRTAREGADGLPADLRALVDAAPLAPTARAALTDDLVRGHCGHLPAERTPNMLLAQRGRDAAMARALQAAHATRGTGPVLLVAGNGHVRGDYGVAQLLRRLQPSARVQSIGFVDGADADAAPYDLVWTTAAPARSDPCAGFSLPPAPPASPASR